MDNTLIKNLNLKSYIKIVINFSKLKQHEDREGIQNHEEQKIDSVDKECNSDIENISNECMIYSIKTATKNKSVKQILQMIKYEFGYVDNDAQIWNQMIDEISLLSINNQSLLQGMIC